MSLSPFDVEHKEFPRRPWGYRRDDVDAFLADVQDTLMGMWQERGDLREEVERLNERVARFAAQETQLKDTLTLANEQLEKVGVQAQREAELAIREANTKAREIVHGAYEERNRLELVMQNLLSAEQEARSRFRALGQAVISHLGDTERSTMDSENRVRDIASSDRDFGRERLRRPDTPLNARGRSDSRRSVATDGETVER